MSGTPTDLELMMYADGELDGDDAARVEAFIEGSGDARTKVDSLAQLGEMMRTYAELETDDAEAEVPGFARLWGDIDRRIHSNGTSKHAPKGKELGSKPAEDSPGFWQTVREWFGQHRGHMVTGLVGAGAACALMLAVGPREKVVEKRVEVAAPAAQQAPTMQVVNLESEPPEVEDLEVYDGTGTILTIEADGEDDSSATVIWISDDEDDMEDPI